MASDSNSDKKGKDIWSITDKDALVAAIASFEDRYIELNDETW